MANQQQGYQIGAGLPVNQQYLQPHEARPGSSTLGGPQQQTSAYTAQPNPEVYNPQAPDIPVGGQQTFNEKYPTPPTGPLGSSNHPEQFPPPPTEGYQTQNPHSYAPPPTSSSGAPSYGQQYPSSGTAPQDQYQHQQFVPPPTSQTFSDVNPPLPPRSHTPEPTSTDPNSPVHYTRDPHRLTAYLIPFPKPSLKGIPAASIPDRFLIYTPPPPPLPKPAEGEKEPRVQKLQRKWQEEVRAAKTSTAKTASWKGVKSKATRGISHAINLTTSSNLDFLNRFPDARTPSPERRHSEDGVHEEETTHRTVGLRELVLIYPSSYNATPEQVKAEFINSMMRSKSKAQRDAVIATGLLPVSAAIDILATVIWPFGGLLEVDGVWAYSSIRGAKTARSVTKRLTSSTAHGALHPAHPEKEDEEQDKLQMHFQQDPRIEVLHRYLSTQCTKRDPKTFPSLGTAVTESEVLEAIGWHPSQTSGEERNWEDEQWETSEVKEDLRSVMGKGAREWDKWCQAFVKSPEKALKR
ncbi:MAG: hypothetical protein Q9191_007243 [Dirinaria sp. TL-2023a]